MASWRQWSTISHDNHMDRHSLRSGWHAFWIYVPVAQKLPSMHLQALDGSLAVRISLKRCTVSWIIMMIRKRDAFIRLRFFFFFFFFFTTDVWVGRNYFAAVSRHILKTYENQRLSNDSNQSIAQSLQSDDFPRGGFLRHLTLTL